LHAGLWDECLQILEQLAQTQPLAAYTRAWALAQSGRSEQALSAYEQAATLAPDFCFPNRIEDVVILQAALRVNPQDGNAHYFLGNFWYGHRRYTEAIQAWEAARTLKPNYPTVWRNLGLAYFNKKGDSKAALACFETAFQLDSTDARVLFELDQLRKSLNVSPQARLEELECYPHLVEQRDDLTVEKISLLNLLDRPAEAYRQLMARIFHPWEGGEGKVTGQYVYSLVEMARKKIATGEASEAAELIFKAKKYPHILGEGKLAGAQENNIYYWLGCAGVELQQPDEAVHWFEQATQGLSEPASAMYYNDQPPDMIFYQGLAQRSLGRTQQAAAIFEKLKDYGQTHLKDVIKMDYFAVSLPDFLVFDVDLNQRNRIHCAYMLGLGALGLQQFDEACAWFSQVLEMNAAHQGARLHLQIAREWMNENGLA
jgi:tetratricopeptide (TPR) repeat protein